MGLGPPVCLYCELVQEHDVSRCPQRSAWYCPCGRESEWCMFDLDRATYDRVVANEQRRREGIRSLTGWRGVMRWVRVSRVVAVSAAAWSRE